jgi:hypothetical protein
MENKKKKNWEAPKLILLDHEQTASGSFPGTEGVITGPGTVFVS